MHRSGCIGSYLFLEESAPEIVQVGVVLMLRVLCHFLPDTLRIDLAFVQQRVKDLVSRAFTDRLLGWDSSVVVQRLPGGLLGKPTLLLGGLVLIQDLGRSTLLKDVGLLVALA